MRCHELENELEAVQQKQLSESAISSLEVVGDKLDTMMKESEMQQEANERLEKELQMANARVEELAKANEECLRQKTKLEEDLQLRDCLFVQAEGDLQLRDGSLAQDQAEIERLTTAWKAAEDAKERLEEIECHRIGREAEMESYKTQLKEIRSALEKTQNEKEDAHHRCELIRLQEQLEDRVAALTMKLDGAQKKKKEYKAKYASLIQRMTSALEEINKSLDKAHIRNHELKSRVKELQKFQ